MLVVGIYEFIKLTLSIIFNDFVFWYALFPGLIAYGIIKIYKEDNEPFIKPMVKFLLIYYVIRTVYVVYIK